MRAQSDVIGLQEIDRLDDLLTGLQGKLPSIAAVESPNFPKDGLVILIDKSKVKCETVEAIPGLRKGMIAKFTHLASGLTFEFVNLHLKARLEFEDFRMEEINLVLKYVEGRADFIVGDLNTNPALKVVPTILQSGRYREGHEGTESDMHLPSSTTSAKFRETKYSTVSDYIFYSTNRKKTEILPVAHLSRFNVEQLCEYLLPCLNYPSDHILTSVRFLLCNTTAS